MNGIHLASICFLLAIAMIWVVRRASDKWQWFPVLVAFFICIAGLLGVWGKLSLPAPDEAYLRWCATTVLTLLVILYGGALVGMAMED